MLPSAIPSSSLPSSMKRCHSACNISLSDTTSMILCNIEVPIGMPRSRSLVSLSQAFVQVLRDGDDDAHTSRQQLNDQIRTKQQMNRFKELGKSWNKSDERYRQQSQCVGMSNTERSSGTRTQCKITEKAQESKCESSRKASKASITQQHRHHRKSRVSQIIRTDTKTTMARTATIPKWITVGMQEMRQIEAPPKPCDAKVIPLTDLAMILSKNLENALSNGLFDTSGKDRGKEVETCSTESLSTVKSSPHQAGSSTIEDDKALLAHLVEFHFSDDFSF